MNNLIKFKKDVLVECFEHFHSNSNLITKVDPRFFDFDEWIINYLLVDVFIEDFYQYFNSSSIDLDIFKYFIVMIIIFINQMNILVIY